MKHHLKIDYFNTAALFALLRPLGYIPHLRRNLKGRFIRNIIYCKNKALCLDPNLCVNYVAVKIEAYYILIQDYMGSQLSILQSLSNP